MNEWWKKTLGVTHQSVYGIDFTWGFYTRSVFNVGWSWSIDDKPLLHLGFLTIYLPIALNVTVPYSEIHEEREVRYGFAIADNLMLLYWNVYSRSFLLPFVSYVFSKGEVQLEDGTWVEERTEDPYCETYPYTYGLKNGTIQNRTATVYKERRTWHRKWFPFFTKTKVSIDVTFDDEVGERSGSWKGGTIGCGHIVIGDETMEETLRRMEETREF